MTSIEWLREELWQQFKWQFSDNIFEVAKEMHKQEIIDAYETSHISMMTSDQYYQETFGSKGSDKHKEKLKELYPDAYSILGEVLYKKCKFEPTINTSSATICKHCGREKFLHTT